MAVCMATEQGDVETLERLLRETKDPKRAVSKPTEAGWIALCLAAEYGRLDCLKVLTAAGADVNARGFRQRTALMHAAAQGYGDCLAFLLSEGADISVADVDRRTALHHAAFNGELTSAQLLLRRDHAPVEAVDGQGRTAAHLAALKDHVAVLSCMRAQGVPLNAPDHDGDTPLHLACAAGHVAAVRLLLGCPGVDMYACSRVGYTPLHRAAKAGKLKVMALLLEAGVDLNCVSQVGAGQAALHVAALNGRLDSLKWLVKVGRVGRTMQNLRGDTATDLARRGGHDDCVTFLKEFDDESADANKSAQLTGIKAELSNFKAKTFSMPSFDF